MNKNLIGITIGLATELSALIIGAYFLAYAIAEPMEWDENLVVAGTITLALIGWFTHVIIIFNRNSEDGEDLPPHSG